MNEQIAYIFGYFITVCNLISFFAFIFVFCRNFYVALTCTQSRRLIRFHYNELYKSFGLLLLNGFALVRFYETWVVNKSFASLGLVTNGFTDRAIMVIVSIVFVMGSAYKFTSSLDDDSDIDVK